MLVMTPTQRLMSMKTAILSWPLRGASRRSVSGYPFDVAQGPQQDISGSGYQAQWNIWLSSSLRGALRRSKPIRSVPGRFARRTLHADVCAPLSVVVCLLVACTAAVTWRDIPTYPGAEEVWRETRTGTVYMETRTYQTDGTTEAVITFYRTKMAELGWEERAAARTEQGFLVRWWKQDGTQVQLQAFASEAGGVVVEITKTGAQP
jgi:hypothetical protein